MTKAEQDASVGEGANGAESGDALSTDVLGLGNLKHLKHLKPLMEKAPKLWKNATKVSERVFGTPETKRKKAGAEGTTDVIRQSGESMSALLKTAANQFDKQIVEGADPEIVVRAFGRISEEAVREQFNLEKTLALATTELETTGTIEDAPAEIDDDWIDSWVRLTRTKSNKELQLYFAKVLAGEIRKPGNFSLKTLLTLSTMDDY